jgi:hypothetical protein
MTSSSAWISSLLVLLTLSSCVAFTQPLLHTKVAGRTSLNVDFLSSLFGGNDPEKPTVVFDIPATDVKVGAIRFFLNIHLVGLQNQPEKGTWFSQQDDSGGLDLYFKDGTAMLSLAFSEYEIKAVRTGAKPSLFYLLQESVLLHGVLDELNNLAFEASDIEEEKRLLRLKESNGIEKARAKLPARKAV